MIAHRFNLETDRSKNQELYKFRAKFLEAERQHSHLMALDGTYHDLDPRDGFVHHIDSGVVISDGSYQFQDSEVQWDDDQVTVTLRRPDLEHWMADEARLLYNKRTHSLTGEISSHSERADGPEPDGYLRAEITELDKIREFFKSAQVDGHRDLGLKLLSKDGHQNDEDTREGFYSGTEDINGAKHRTTIDGRTDQLKMNFEHLAKPGLTSRIEAPKSVQRDLNGATTEPYSWTEQNLGELVHYQEWDPIAYCLRGAQKLQKSSLGLIRDELDAWPIADVQFDNHTI